MMNEILFILGTMKATHYVNKKYKWYENLEITIRSYKPLFIANIWYWSSVILIMTLVNIYELFEKYEIDFFNEKIALYGTNGTAIGLYLTLFVVMLCIYFTMKVFEKDKKIEKIKEKYGDNYYECYYE